MGHGVKTLPEGWADAVCCAPLISQARHFIAEGSQLGQAPPPLAEAVLTSPDAFLVLRVLRNGSQD